MAPKLRMLGGPSTDPDAGTVTVEVPVGALPAVMAVLQLARTTAAPSGLPSEKLLLSRPAAAAALSVSVGTLDQMIRRGDIPSIHVGGTRATRVSVADIQKYIVSEAARCLVWARPTDGRSRE